MATKKKVIKEEVGGVEVDVALPTDRPWFEEINSEYIAPPEIPVLNPKRPLAEVVEVEYDAPKTKPSSKKPWQE